MADVTEIDIDGRGAATLWLNRPEVHNAFDEAVIDALARDLKKLEADPAVRLVVLAGRGKSFCAGADINWMKRQAAQSEADNLRDAGVFADMLRVLNSFRKPTIAAVQGNAFGGGVGLIACCDIAFAVEGALFAVSEVRLGIIPSVIGPYLVAAIGERQARRYALTAERFTAQEAQRIGLVHQICKPEALPITIAQTIDAICACGPKAQETAKEHIRDIANRPIDAGVIAGTAQRIARIRATPEAREGFAAFLEKRKPTWSV